MKKIICSPWLKGIAVILFLASLTLGVLAGVQGGQKLNEEADYIYDFGASPEDSWYICYLVGLPEETVLGAFWELTYEQQNNSPSNFYEAEEETIPATVDIYGNLGTEDEVPSDPTWEFESSVGEGEEPIPNESEWEKETLEDDLTGVTTPTATMSESETQSSHQAQRRALTREEEAFLLQRIERSLSSLAYPEYIEYYVNLNGTVFSNNGITDPRTLRTGLFKYFALGQEGDMEFYAGRNAYHMPWIYDCGVEDLQLDLIMATRVRPEYVEKYTRLWDKQEALLYTTGARILVCGLSFLLSLVYLICVCGKDSSGNSKTLWVDKIWVEFHLAVMGGTAFGGVYLCYVIIEETFGGRFPMDLAYLLPAIVCVLGGGLILCGLLALIRNIKAGTFAQRCGILWILKKLLSFLWLLCKGLWKGIRRLFRVFCNLKGIPFTIFQISVLFVYTLLTVIGVAILGESEDEVVITVLILLFLLFGVGAFFMARRGKELDEIKKGASGIRSGDLSHAIPEPKSPDLIPLAQDINHIAKGLDNALTARLKAERMKTELITNVSHDLKTPLTSIITYTELLSRVEGLPEEAGDYIRVIGDKSQRLKTLTQDLFDISKVQSGNEEVRWEVLDAALLLQQSLAEERGDSPEDSRIFCLKTEENLSFMGDGGKLSRVLGNLIQNAGKYAMEGTRIFLSAYRREDRVVIECKNTSAYAIDFTPEEILGRFVRGDSARSTEGNGLGLPIAKSYTELCGGSFELILDGDLFKVLLSFPGAQ